jgi:hypothetical protein
MLFIRAVVPATPNTDPSMILGSFSGTTEALDVEIHHVYSPKSGFDGFKIVAE